MVNERDMVRWISIVGARPQFIKVAPVCRAIEAHNQRNEPPKIHHVILHTGQHYDREMAELFFEQLRIPEPFCNLGVGSDSHGVQLGRMLDHLEPVLANECPDWVIVYGDTNSTLAGALMAARLGLGLTHVEAGCRSHNMRMPEEQNRVVADHLSDVLLAPSHNAVQNLQREGIGGPDDPQRRRVVFVGDVMRDALLANVRLAERYATNNMSKFALEPGRYYLLTLHRAENTESAQNLQKIITALETLDLPVLFPIHPRTRRLMTERNIAVGGPNLHITTPLGYFEMLVMEKHAHKILTDSGGVQKEAFYLGVPCITLRDQTEWPETVEVGANRIAGIEPARVLESIRMPYPPLATDVSPYGDGKASEHIVQELLAADRLMSDLRRS